MTRKRRDKRDIRKQQTQIVKEDCEERDCGVSDEDGSKWKNRRGQNKKWARETALGMNGWNMVLRDGEEDKPVHALDSWLCSLVPGNTGRPRNGSTAMNLRSVGNKETLED